MNAWPLIWSHGDGAVESLGGMLGPVHFRLPDGTTAQPFAIFPWADEPLPAAQQAVTGLMSRGRGEWPCVPFGVGPGGSELGWQHPIHGDAAHGLWQRIDGAPDDASMRLRFDCGPEGPVDSLERHLSGVPGEPQIDCELIVRVRRRCELPIGLHPTLRLPTRLGALQLDPGTFQFGRTYPHEVEPGADIVAPGHGFSELSAVPRHSGGTVDLRRFPLGERTESLLQLCGVEGRVSATYVDEGFRFVVAWDPAQLPSCLLWVSNGGRGAWPWSGRHRALGIEPICSTFDLGVRASTQPSEISARGVRTAVALDPQSPLVIRYRLGVEPIARAEA